MEHGNWFRAPYSYYVCLVLLLSAKNQKVSNNVSAVSDAVAYFLHY